MELGRHHFSLKDWPTVFLCIRRLRCRNGIGTFTTFGGRRRISGGSAGYVDTLTACFTAPCTRGGSRSGSGGGEGCHGFL